MAPLFANPRKCLSRWMLKFSLCSTHGSTKWHQNIDRTPKKRFGQNRFGTKMGSKSPKPSAAFSEFLFNLNSIIGHHFVFMVFWYVQKFRNNNISCTWSIFQVFYRKVHFSLDLELDLNNVFCRCYCCWMVSYYHHMNTSEFRLFTFIWCCVSVFKCYSQKWDESKNIIVLK